MIVSVLSVAILIIYRHENSKLKYVLEVVNFFGRSDSVSLVRLENGTTVNPAIYNFDHPLPMWTRLDNDFQAYSSYWHKNSLNVGGEVVTVTVGLQSRKLRFRCQLMYSNGQSSSGLFSYIRLDKDTDTPPSSKNVENWSVYKFTCKTNRDYGSASGPHSIIFRDLNTGADHFMPVKDLSPALDTTKPALPKITVAICIDFTPYNLTKDVQQQTNYFTEREILQFFLHHQLVGIDEFLLYETNNFPTKVQDLLYHHGIRVTRLPYNFPFELNNEVKNRIAIETDCLLRTSVHVKQVFVARFNEYFYPPDNIKRNRTFIRSLDIHPHNINRFEMIVKPVCVPPVPAGDKRLFADFHLFGATVERDRPYFVYRPMYELQDRIKSIELDRNSGHVQRYTRNCTHKANDDLQDWRQTLAPEQMKFISTHTNELRNLLN